jgi:hypothetical protein
MRDAQITDMAPGAKQLITYALVLDTEVSAAPAASPVSLVSVKISKGIMVYTNRAQRERDHAVTNWGTKPRTLLIEHPLQSDWTLQAPKEPLERTRDSYRFALPVAAGKSATLAVIEMKMIDQSVSLASLSGDQVAYYLRSTVVSAAVKTALTKLAALQQKLSDTVAQRTPKEARVAEISADQSRVRDNMDRLWQSSDLYKRYVKTLTDEEDELAKLRDDIAKLRD